MPNYSEANLSSSRSVLLRILMHVGGAVHYQSSSAKWSRLNSVAAIYDMRWTPRGEQPLRVLGMELAKPA